MREYSVIAQWLSDYSLDLENYAQLLKMYVNGQYPCAIRDLMLQRGVPISDANKLLSQIKIREMRADRGGGASHGQVICLEVPTGAVIKNSFKKTRSGKVFR